LGRVTEVYSKLLELRWCFVALEQVWLHLVCCRSLGISSLEFDEVRRVVEGSDSVLNNQLGQLVARRRSQLEQDRQLEPVLPGLRQFPTQKELEKEPRKSSGQGVTRNWCQSASAGGKGAANLQAVPEIDRDDLVPTRILAGQLCWRGLVG